MRGPSVGQAAEEANTYLEAHLAPEPRLEPNAIGTTQDVLIGMVNAGPTLSVGVRNDGKVRADGTGRFATRTQMTNTAPFG